MKVQHEADPFYCQDLTFLTILPPLQHHLKEVQEKWDSIEDEIWGKLIFMEKNRRVAKAYARVPMLTVDGSEDGFDGYHIGLSGFDNAKRDAHTARIKQHIGEVWF